jgi:hypothetical protein
MKLKLIILATFAATAAIVLSGCTDDGKGPGNPDAYQNANHEGVAGACSTTFINDFNEIIYGIRAALKYSTQVDTLKLEDARKKAVEFKLKYDGVFCNAEIKKTSQSNYVKASINATAEMNEIISQIDAILEAAKINQEQKIKKPQPLTLIEEV